MYCYMCRPTQTLCFAPNDHVLQCLHVCKPVCPNILKVNTFGLNTIALRVQVDFIFRLAIKCQKIIMVYDIPFFMIFGQKQNDHVRWQVSLYFTFVYFLVLRDHLDHFSHTDNSVLSLKC